MNFGGGDTTQAVTSRESMGCVHLTVCQMTSLLALTANCPCDAFSFPPRRFDETR